MKKLFGELEISWKALPYKSQKIGSLRKKIVFKL